jgi:enamine deaminase RidA (YjgF/YER057c/UK114 family)
MSSRINYSTASEWESKVGYSRAVKIGNYIEVSGTVALDENNLVIGEKDAYLQTKFILQKIETTLIKAGATLKDVVRTRMFVTDISKWQEVGKAHGEFFKNIHPCATMVEVKALIAPQFLVEIEATAIMDKIHLAGE